MSNSIKVGVLTDFSTDKLYSLPIGLTLSPACRVASAASTGIAADRWITQFDVIRKPKITLSQASVCFWSPLLSCLHCFSGHSCLFHVLLSLLQASEVPDLLEQLQECNVQLDIVEKGLNDLLDTKKMAFPRC